MSDSDFDDAVAYDAIADAYDLEHAGFDADVDLYRTLATVVGDPILELGCGSGRVLVPLAEAGFRVTGMDTSASMLARAAARLDETGLSERVTLHRGDMRRADAAPGGPFGLVIVGLNGLLHLTTPAAQQSLLVAARRALDPRGQLVIDVFNPMPDLLHDLDRGVAHEGSWPHTAGGTVDKWSSRRLVASEQLLETTIWYDHLLPDGTIRRTRAAFGMRYVFSAELVLMLAAAGFVELQVYGGYDLEPYDDAAERLIVTAEVNPSTS